MEEQQDFGIDKSISAAKHLVADRAGLAGGAPVMCVPDLIGAPIVGCAQPPTPTTKPCTTVVATLPGSWSLKVLAGGRPVYVATVSGQTDGVPPSPIMVAFPGQTLVQG